MFNLTRALAPALAVTVLGSTALLAGSAPADAVPVAAKRRADTFQMATFNVQGDSHHTRRPSASRMYGAVRYLRKHRVDVAGLQEFEKKQYRVFRNQTHRRWAVVGAPSRSGRSWDPRNAITFRMSRFKLVSATSIPIPYFHGNRVNIPVATLRSRTTGRVFTVINTHNPADVHGNAQRYRNIATARQIRMVKRLRAKTRRTVFVTGDMNEKAPYFCKMTRSGAMHAAAGGSTGPRCRAPKRHGIDWIFGSRGVSFSGWRTDTATRTKGVSDHAIVVTNVTLPR